MAGRINDQSVFKLYGEIRLRGFPGGWILEAGSWKLEFGPRRSWDFMQWFWICLLLCYWIALDFWSNSVNSRRWTRCLQGPRLKERPSRDQIPHCSSSRIPRSYLLYFSTPYGCTPVHTSKLKAGPVTSFICALLRKSKHSFCSCQNCHRPRCPCNIQCQKSSTVE